MSRLRFTFERTESVLRCVTGLADVVLVGGQALNHWCERYPSAPELLGNVYTSKDVDFQGTKQDLLEAAQRLSGTPVFVEQDSTSFLGYVEFDPGDGDGPARVDFLSSPLGLASAAVRDAAVPFARDGIEILVMHPVHCLASRVHNVIEVPEKYDNDHGLGQLRAAIACLREFIGGRLASDMRGALDDVEALFEFAGKQVACDLSRRKAIDVLEAVPKAGLPDKFYEKRLPQLRDSLDRARAPK